MGLNEFIVEEAARSWFGELGYAIGHEAHMASCELQVKVGEPCVAEATQ